MRYGRRFLVYAAIFVYLASCQSFVFAYQGQRWKPAHDRVKIDYLRPEKGEVSVDRIVEACDRFLSDIGIKKPKNIIPSVNRSVLNKVKSGIYSVFYEPLYLFSVRADTGKVQTFSNMGREFEYSHGKKQKRPFVLADPINAKGYLNRMRKKLGLGDNYQIVKYECNLNGDKHNWELGKVGFVRIKLEAFEYGYSLGTFRHAGLTVDPQDGALISFGAPSDVPIKIESHTAKLSFDQAKERASPTASKYNVGIYRRGCRVEIIGLKYGDKMPDSKKPSKLQYVLPNGQFGGIKHDSNDLPRRLRLAWVLIYPGDEQIWVDAGDGKILGGISKVMK